jgi:cytochrome oxidase Cu insertion factor (SCO1/SenC/PrrC family)
MLFLISAGAIALADASDRSADYDYDAPAPGSYTLPVIKPAADGALLDPKGRPLRLAELTRGRITVMSFIYTRCAAAKACPYATGVLLQLHRASADDPALAKELRLVSMSFDPANDTPERMAPSSGISVAPSSYSYTSSARSTSPRTRPAPRCSGRARGCAGCGHTPRP